MRVTNILLAAAAGTLMFAAPAAAQEAAAGAASGGVGTAGAALIGMALAAVGGAWGQSKLISVALESIARNPGASGEMKQPWLLGLVFIESLVIYVLALPIILKLFGIL